MNTYQSTLTSPAGVALSPSGNKLYVVGASSVEIIDPVTLNLITSVPLTGTGQGISVAPDGSIWVTQTTPSGEAQQIVIVDQGPNGSNGTPGT